MGLPKLLTTSIASLPFTHAGRCTLGIPFFFCSGTSSSSTICPPPWLLMFGPLEGVVFGDYGSDLGSRPTIPGDPAGACGKPGSGFGYGVGIRVDSPQGPLRLEYAFNDKQSRRFHFGVGHRN